MLTILVAGALSLFGTLVGTRLLISLLVARGYGQFIRDDGPTSHSTKRGTPTMGGIVIIITVLVAYLVAHLVTWTPITITGVLILWLLTGLGVIGFVDDFTKISKQRSLGLTARGKLIGQGLVGGSFAVLALLFPDERGVRPASVFVSFLRDIDWLQLPAWLAVAFMVILVVGASNATNLTDGLDGLLPGSAAIVFAAYAVLSLWQFNQWCGLNSAGPTCYDVRSPLDQAVIATALAGACVGFLWWNAKPAKIFIGDTGSLALGGALAGLAITSRTELLLVIMGGLFVFETVAVMLQVGYFKLTGGKRLFKMAPIHHHFELLGWAEVTVVIRFWIIAGICVAIGLGIFYASWVVTQ